MKSRLTSAVREGARYASVQADPVASAQAVRNVVKAAAIPIGSAALTDAQISVALNSATKRVTVSVASYSLRFITPFASTIGRSAVTMSASSVLPWERGS